MNISIKDIDSINFEIESKIEKKEIDEKVETIIKKLSKDVNISGFRKGKVPAKLVRDRYAGQAYEEALQELCNNITQKALEDKKVDTTKLAARPIVKDKSINDDGSENVAILISLFPEINLKDYMKYIPKVKVDKVSKKDIDARINEVKNTFADIKELKTKRALKNGDFAVIDFEGFLGDTPFNGGSAKDHTLEIGSKSFIGNFEEQLIGLSTGEKKDVKVKFPDDYQESTLAGKDALFKVKLNSIKVRSRVTLNEELIKKIIPDEKEHTVEVLEKSIEKELLIKNKNLAFNEDIKKKTVEALIKNYEFDIPLTLLDSELGYMINDKVKSMSKEDISKLSADSKLIDELKDEFKPEATRRIKAAYIMNTCSTQLKIDVSEDEVSRVIYFEALQLRKDPKELLEEYNKNGTINSIKMAMIEDKTLRYMLDEKNRGENNGE